MAVGSVPSILVGLGLIVTIGSIAGLISVGVVYSNAASFPKTTVTTTRLIYPQAQQTVATIDGVNLGAANITLTQTTVETLTTYMFSNTLEIGGTFAGSLNRKRGNLDLIITFTVSSFFSITHPATDLVGNIAVSSVTYLIGVSPRLLTCTVNEDATSVVCTLTTILDELVNTGTLTSPITFSYTINK